MVIITKFRLFLSIIAVWTLLHGVALAADFNPATTAQLIADIQTANTNNQDDTINLVAGGFYNLSGNEPGAPFSHGARYGDNGLPIFVDDGGHMIIINGNGATIQRLPFYRRILGDLQDACNPDFPNFCILQLDGANLTLNDLTITNGCGTGQTSDGFESGQGGGILMTGGILTINNSTIIGNSTMIEEVEGGLAFTGVGGGVFINTATGSVAINNSLIADNIAQLGGGIFNLLADVSIVNSTINGNRAQNGGGIYNNTTAPFSLDLFSCTFANNLATLGEGLFNVVDVSFLAFNDPSGTIDPSITNIRNTLFAGDDCMNDDFGGTLSGESVAGVVNDLGGNLSDRSDDDPCGDFFNENFNASSMLGPLADNGGPTHTRALLMPASGPANPAIGGVSDCIQLVDQRGSPRSLGAACDIGAFETQSTGKLTIEKITLPAGGAGYEFLGTDILEGCGLLGTFFLDDMESQSCILPLGTYTVEEVMVPAGFELDIMCTETPSSETPTSVTIDIGDGDGGGTCFFTNTRQFTLDVTLGGAGDWTVTSAPAGINCGEGNVDCSEDYLSGEMVTLTADPDIISSFAGWGGDCTGAGLMTTVTVDADKTCTATFNYKNLVLTKANPGINGVVNRIQARNASPGGRVSFYMGFQTGNNKSNAACPDVNIGIKHALGIGRKNGNASAKATVKFYLNTLGQNLVYFRAIDEDTCRLSNLRRQIIP